LYSSFLATVKRAKSKPRATAEATKARKAMKEERR
jgi:hypothetical protein